MKLTKFAEDRKENSKEELEKTLKNLIDDNERLAREKNPLANYPLALQHIEDIKYLISLKK